MDRVLLQLAENAVIDDVLNSNLFPYISLSKLAQALLGNNPVLNFSSMPEAPGVTPTSPASLTINVADCEMYIIKPVDDQIYGDIPASTAQILKQGILKTESGQTPITLTPPGTPGFSINYLIQFSFGQTDGVPMARSFYNGAPQSVPTVRQNYLIVEHIPGPAAITGTQTTPTPAEGSIGGYVVSVANGQTQITSDDINPYPNAPILTERLIDKISQATANALYAAKANVPPAPSFIIGGNLSKNPWQYGTPLTNLTNGQFTANRFAYVKSGTMVHSASKIADAPSFLLANQVLTQCLQFEVTTAQASLGANDFCAAKYCVEGFDWAKYARKPIMIQLLVKADVTGIYSVALSNNNSVASADAYFLTEINITAVDTWQLFNILVPASPNFGTWKYDNGTGLRIQVVLAAGTGLQGTVGTWTAGYELSSVNQVNSCATVGNKFSIALLAAGDANNLNGFDEGSVQEIQLKCERYARFYGQGLTGVASSTNTLAIAATIPIPMRNPPAASVYPVGSNIDIFGMASFGADTLLSASAAVSGSSPSGISFDLTGTPTSPLPNGEVFYINNLSQTGILFEAELV